MSAPSALFPHLDDTADQRQLRSVAADFVRREARPAPGVKGAGNAAARALDATRWPKMAELGWLAALVPESCGGLGLTLADLAVIHQEAGRGALIEPLIPVSLLAARPLALGRSEALRTAVLPGLLEGRVLATLAWQGQAGGLSWRQAGPVASRTATQWRIEGRAMFVPAVARCQGMVVAAREPGGVLLGWVPLQPGIEVQPATGADAVEVGTTVQFNGVELPEAQVIACGAQGAELLDDVLDVARVAAGAQLLGLMDQMLEMTLEYIRQRVQFGKPIGSFQALQHRAVDIYVQVELARSALQHALRSYTPGQPDQAGAAAVSRAKSRCSDAALFTVKNAIQLHGAIAYSEEYALSRYIRRAIALAAFLGNGAAHRRRYAALALDRETR